MKPPFLLAGDFFDGILQVLFPHGEGSWASLQAGICSSLRLLLNTPCVCSLWKWNFTMPSLDCGVGREWRRKSESCPSSFLNMWMFHLAFKSGVWPLLGLCHVAALGFLPRKKAISAFLSLRLLEKYNARGLSQCSPFPWRHCFPSP